MSWLPSTSSRRGSGSGAGSGDRAQPSSFGMAAITNHSPSQTRTPARPVAARVMAAWCCSVDIAIRCGASGRHRSMSARDPHLFYTALGVARKKRCRDLNIDCSANATPPTKVIQRDRLRISISIGRFPLKFWACDLLVNRNLARMCLKTKTNMAAWDRVGGFPEIDRRKYGRPGSWGRP